MGQVRVRNLDDAVVREFKDRAERMGTSVESILRKLITAEAKRPRREMLDDLLLHQDAIRANHGILPDSTPEIREERDRWS